MRIPDIQKRLLEISSETDNSELRDLALALSRRKSFFRATPTSEKMTDALRTSIRRYVRKNPGMPQTHVAAKFNVNPGRVSEVTRGYRR